MDHFPDAVVILFIWSQLYPILVVYRVLHSAVVGSIIIAIHIYRAIWSYKCTYSSVSFRSGSSISKSLNQANEINGWPIADDTVEPPQGIQTHPLSPNTANTELMIISLKRLGGCAFIWIAGRLMAGPGINNWKIELHFNLLEID